jgi:hypothetical protein
LRYFSSLLILILHLYTSAHGYNTASCLRSMPGHTLSVFEATIIMLTVQHPSWHRKIKIIKKKETRGLGAFGAMALLVSCRLASCELSLCLRRFVLLVSCDVARTSATHLPCSSALSDWCAVGCAASQSAAFVHSLGSHHARRLSAGVYVDPAGPGPAVCHQPL